MPSRQRILDEKIWMKQTRKHVCGELVPTADDERLTYTDRLDLTEIVWKIRESRTPSSVQIIRRVTLTKQSKVFTCLLRLNPFFLFSFKMIEITNFLWVSRMNAKKWKTIRPSKLHQVRKNRRPAAFSTVHVFSSTSSCDVLLSISF